MIEYLREFVTPTEYDSICAVLDEKQKIEFEVMQDNVYHVLSYLAEIGVKNLGQIIIERPDLCFRSKETLIAQFSVIDQDLLIKLISENLDDLHCFGI